MQGAGQVAGGGGGPRRQAGGRALVALLQLLGARQRDGLGVTVAARMSTASLLAINHPLIDALLRREDSTLWSESRSASSSPSTPAPEPASGLAQRRRGAPFAPPDAGLPAGLKLRRQTGILWRPRAAACAGAAPLRPGLAAAAVSSSSLSVTTTSVIRT